MCYNDHIPKSGISNKREIKEMHIVLSNLSWMGFNVLLALVAVLFGWFMKGTRWTLLRILCGAVWIIFLPNTLYLLTDIIHLHQNAHRVEGVDKLVVLGQYILLILLGITTYFAAVYPAEKVAVEKVKCHRIAFILLVNALVSFGIILGRVERVNSWYFVTNLPRVLHDSLQVLTSLNLLLLMLFLTVLSTLLYLSLRVSLPSIRRQI